jgi:hypothetical protein
MVRHEPEQVELARSQPEWLAAPGHLSARGVDHEPVEGQPLVGHQLELSAAEHCANPSSELARRERLGHVVVGPELEPDDPVGLLAAGRQHDHRQARARTDPPAQLEAVCPRKHEIEDDEVGRLALDQLAGAISVRGLERREAVALEVPDHDLADRRLVVDNENLRHGRKSERSSVKRP